MTTAWYVEGKERAVKLAESQVVDADIIRVLCHEFPITYGNVPARKRDREKRHSAVTAKVVSWADELENARATGRAEVSVRLYELRAESGHAGVSATVALAREMGASVGMDREVARMVKHLRTLEPEQLHAEIERWAAAIA